MGRIVNQETVDKLAAKIHAEVEALPIQNSPSIRSIRRKYSRLIKSASPTYVMDLSKQLIDAYGYRGLAYELIQHHREAFDNLGEQEIELLGTGIDSWWSVDLFGRLISGPAWLKNQISDGLIHRWARSSDRWWRRAALVSTVALNSKTNGGQGDASRTLSVCRILAADPDDMVVKSLSWALRVLSMREPESVRAFLGEHESVLAARVKREVRNKMRTGLKNPRKETP